ncbi:ribonuclease E activity regulator RraA [Methylicorpusculum oleiharenae]|uniref:ribonuclease E activity regulator RraA n=1 Tax=Methylicorpusculum oleiharenae TaxID=1338687 RepID=UPI00135678D8|nr:ribonuclease E activity regulator RraA [Methylicorpusculum oleiharenae]MCD2449178.1 ribonuclease E activity regulator RraA [Methylicorpusculum oleiharenae]
MTFATAKLCDTYSAKAHLQIAEPIFKLFGAALAFSGQITTLKVFEDNALVRTALSTKVNHRILVIDGGGSHRCALIDEELAQLALENGWQGIVVYGCIRDSAIINAMTIGIRALHAHPLKSPNKGLGNLDTVVTFAGVQFKNDYFLYADSDGIIVSETELS